MNNSYWDFTVKIYSTIGIHVYNSRLIPSNDSPKSFSVAASSLTWCRGSLLHTHRVGLMLVSGRSRNGWTYRTILPNPKQRGKERQKKFERFAYNMHAWALIHSILMKPNPCYSLYHNAVIKLTIRPFRICVNRLQQSRSYKLRDVKWIQLKVS